MAGAKRRISWFSVLTSILTLFSAAFLIINHHSVQAAASFNSARNCDNNAVIFCGAMNTAELQQRYNASTTTQAVYTCFGITATDIGNIGNTAVAGSVTKDGQVLVDGQVVAVNAVTAGLQNIAGSTVNTQCGVTFYERPPSVSFLDNSLDAFVVMNNGQFQFAILASCGNPVKATPTIMPMPMPQPQPQPQPTPPTPQPQPMPAPAQPTTINNINNNVNTNTNTQQQQQTQSQSQSVIINQAATPAQTQTQTAPQPQQITSTPTQTQLPNTGPGNMVGIFGGTSALSGVGHWFYRRRKLSV